MRIWLGLAVIQILHSIKQCVWQSMTAMPLPCSLGIDYRVTTEHALAIPYKDNALLEKMMGFGLEQSARAVTGIVEELR